MVAADEERDYDYVISLFSYSMCYRMRHRQVQSKAHLKVKYFIKLRIVGFPLHFGLLGLGSGWENQKGH